MEHRASKSSEGRKPGLGAELLVVALVVACLGGALVLVVATYRRQARLRTPPVAVTRPIIPAPALPEPSPVAPPAPLAVPADDPTPKALERLAALEAEQKQAADAADRRLKAIEQARASTKSRAARWRRRESLARSQIEALDDKAHRLEAEAEALAFERDALMEERDATRADLERAKLRAGAPNSFALLPYKGTNGTWRRPIAIDCRDGEATLLPDGPTYTSLDLSDRLGLRANPLVTAVAMAMVKAQRQPTPDGAPVVPYILFVIRPDGIRTYYEARGQLERLGIAFGYELADPDWEIEVVEDDPPPAWTAGNPRRKPSDGLQGAGPTSRDPADRNVWRERPPGAEGFGHGGLAAGGGRFSGRASGTGLGGFGVPDSYVLAEPPANGSGVSGLSRRDPEFPNLEPTPPFQPNPGRGGTSTTASAGTGSPRPDPEGGLEAIDPGNGSGTPLIPGGGLGNRAAGDSGTVEGTPSPSRPDSRGMDGLATDVGSGSDGFLPLEPFASRPPQPGGDAALSPFGAGKLGAEEVSGGTGTQNQGQAGRPADRRGLPPGGDQAGPGALGSPTTPPLIGSLGQPMGRQAGLPRGSASGGGGGGGGGDGAGQGASLPSGEYVSHRPDLPLQLVVACGPAGLTIHPGGYQLTTSALEEKDHRLVRTLRTIVSAQQRAEPGMTVRPEVRFLVEPGGQSSYWTAREQTILAGLGWPVSLKVAESEPLRVFSGETR